MNSIALKQSVLQAHRRAPGSVAFGLQKTNSLGQELIDHAVDKIRSAQADDNQSTACH
jgi:hypothetical protein